MQTLRAGPKYPMTSEWLHQGVTFSGWNNVAVRNNCRYYISIVPP